MENTNNNSFFDGGPKTMFYTGLFLGIAVSSMIGMGVVLNLIAKGGLALGGGTAIAAAPSPSAAPDPSAAAPAAPAGPLKPVVATDHIMGAKNAKVTLVEYSDFQCPFCQRHLPTIQQALKDYPNDVRLVYRFYPLSFHPEAQKSAESAQCAFAQGGDTAFWKMHDLLFTNQATLARPLYTELAKQIGLDTAKFDKCVDGGEMASRIASDLNEGTSAGVEGTPATFVNGTLISGAVPYSDMKAAIDLALKK